MVFFNVMGKVFRGGIDGLSDAIVLLRDLPHQMTEI